MSDCEIHERGKDSDVLNVNLSVAIMSAQMNSCSGGKWSSLLRLEWDTLNIDSNSIG